MPEQPPQTHPQAARVTVRVAGIVVVWVTQRLPGRLVGTFGGAQPAPTHRSPASRRASLPGACVAR
jgi:hypothetical protein